MGFLRPEQVTLPVRFVFLTTHFIAVLVVIFDVDSLVSNLTHVNPNNVFTPESEIQNFNSEKNTIEGLTYAAIACFALEYITLIVGISIFMRSVTLLNILAHFFGTLLIIFWIIDTWNVPTYIAWITIFTFAPLVLELLVLALASRFTFGKY